MVVMPLELARSVLEPLQGSQLLDLKENADLETINRLNKQLNLQDGEDDKKPAPVPPPPPPPDSPRSSAYHTPPSKMPRRKLYTTPLRPATKKTVRQKLQKTNAFNTKSKHVQNWQGRSVKHSDIDAVLAYAYGERDEEPAGTKELAQRIKLLGYKNFPNSEFNKLVDKATPQPRRTRWTKF